MNGRIGSSGKHVHIILKYDEPTKWGISLCGVWAGSTDLTEEPPTCPVCIRKSEMVK